jgi:hypothetical protein
MIVLLISSMPIFVELVLILKFRSIYHLCHGYNVTCYQFWFSDIFLSIPQHKILDIMLLKHSKLQIGLLNVTIKLEIKQRKSVLVSRMS